jgi:hypothetical protein
MPLIMEETDKKITYFLNNKNFHPNFAIIGQKADYEISDNLYR